MKWFAWYPVQIAKSRWPEPGDKWVWWKWVERWNAPLDVGLDVLPDFLRPRYLRHWIREIDT
jgi:hypothetical protein